MGMGIEDLLDLLRRPPWWEEAKCLGAGPEHFFPEKGGRSYADAARAKDRCNGLDGAPPCPVRKECLYDALVRGERHGVWGGMSQRERRKVRQVYIANGIIKVSNSGFDGDEAVGL